VWLTDVPVTIDVRADQLRPLLLGFRGGVFGAAREQQQQHFVPAPQQLVAVEGLGEHVFRPRAIRVVGVVVRGVCGDREHE